MEIPIFNSLSPILVNNFKKNLYLNKLNNLNLFNNNSVKFPLSKLINNLPKNDSLFETILVSVNDELVKLFLKKKITYTMLIKFLIKIIKKKEFIKYKNIEPKKIADILKLNNLIKIKIQKN